MNLDKINHHLAPMLRDGKIGVLPTDTIYGIVGTALKKKTVLTIYSARKRSPKKPMIILIGSVRDIRKFSVPLTPKVKNILKHVWPGAVSVVLPLNAKGVRGALQSKKFEYLHRGTKTLAFRLPKPLWLRRLLKKTGPLVAPSANLEGEKPAATIRDAKRYFDDRVDFYIDAGRRVAKPSTLIAIKNGKLIVMRKGQGKIGGAMRDSVIK